MLYIAPFYIHLYSLYHAFMLCFAHWLYAVALYKTTVMHSAIVNCIMPSPHHYIFNLYSAIVSLLLLYLLRHDHANKYGALF